MCGFVDAVPLALPLHPHIAGGQIPARRNDDRALNRLSGAEHRPRQLDIDLRRRTAGDLLQRPDVGRGVAEAGDHGEFGLLVHISPRRSTIRRHDQLAICDDDAGAQDGSRKVAASSVNTEVGVGISAAKTPIHSLVSRSVP